MKKILALFIMLTFLTPLFAISFEDFTKGFRDNELMFEEEKAGKAFELDFEYGGELNTLDKIKKGNDWNDLEKNKYTINIYRIEGWATFIFNNKYEIVSIKPGAKLKVKGTYVGKQGLGTTFYFTNCEIIK